MKVLKLLLWICGIGCVIAIPFMILPWSIVENFYRCFGEEPIPHIPVAVYLFRVVCGIFGLIGIYFIILARNPLRYGIMLILSAYGLIAWGLLCLTFGLILQLSPVFYIWDALFGLVIGIAIAILSSKALRTADKENI